MGDGVWKDVVARGARFRAYGRILETPDPVPALQRPAPKPGPTLVPRSLSVTEIETLIRDPYAIYARHVLGLDALEPLAASPSAAARGTIIHDLLARFVQRYPAAMPDRRGALALFPPHWPALDALGPLAASPSAAARGTIIHDLLARFVQRYPAAMPDRREALAFFLKEGGAAFEPIERLSPRLHAEWWPRFQAVA